MSRGEPVIEILMTTYNGEKYLRAQIDSILAQTDARWRLTISDDGSADATPEIIDEYAERYPERIERHRAGRRFGNARDHFFYLMQRCDSPYMAFCDQDDVWYTGKIEKMMRAMQQEEAQRGGQTPILVFSDQTVTDGQMNAIAPSLMRYQKQYFEHFDYRSILMQNVVTGGAMMINRTLARLAGRCAEPSQVIMHDWWLAAVAARFGRIAYIDEPLSAYRQHGNNCVGAKDVGSITYARRMVSNLTRTREMVLRKKAQAQAFAQTYAAQLDDEDQVFLLGFAKSQSGLRFYWENRKLIHGGFRLVGMMLLG